MEVLVVAALIFIVGVTLVDASKRNAEDYGPGCALIGLLATGLLAFAVVAVALAVKAQ